MVRETRYLWVGNLPEKVTEAEISQHFERYGKIQSVKIQPQKENERPCATVAFMDIKSASKAHNTENTVEGVPVRTEYSEPTATGNTITITRTHDGDSASRALFKQNVVVQTAGRFPNRSEGTTEERGYDHPEFYTAGSTRTGEGSGGSSYEGRRSSGFEDGEQFSSERGWSKQRFPTPQSGRAGPGYQRQQSYDRDSSQPSSQVSVGSATRQQSYEGTFIVGEKEKRSRGKWGGHSPARSDASRSRKHSQSPTGSKSRSSSEESTHSSSTNRSKRSQSVGSKVRKAGEKKSSLVSLASQPSDASSSQDQCGDKKNLGICIRGLPLRSSDTSLRDGLFHEYKKHGKVTSVHVFGAGEERYSIVSFKKNEDACKACEASADKMFFGTKITVSPHEGFEVEDDDFKPPEADMDEFHPKATRTLFVGNLEKEITTAQLREIFKPFGEIIDVDIKKQGAVSAYAFVQYADISSVVRAMRKMDGEHIGANKIKLGFGKSMPTNCVWIDGVADAVSEKFLCRTFGRFGPVTHSVIDKAQGRGLVYFENMDFAQYAVSEMRGRTVSGKKLQIDFASRDCQNGFFEKMECSGQLRPGERPDERSVRFTRQAGQFPQRYEEKEGSFERTGFTFTQNRGRGFQNSTRGSNFRQSRGTRGNRGGTAQGTFFETTFTGDTDYRTRRRNEFGQADNAVFPEDSYEYELRDYEYQQQRERREHGSLSPPRDRRNVRSDSPTFARNSRHPSPVHERDRFSERYSDKYSFRDTDSQSGDRDSVRGFRTVRGESRAFRDRPAQYEEVYDTRFVEEKSRGVSGRFSPTSSDYSKGSRSPTRYRSRSLSPLSKERTKQKDRIVRARTPLSPSRDDYAHSRSSRHSSPMDYLPYKDVTKHREGMIKSKVEKPVKDFYQEPRELPARYSDIDIERTVVPKVSSKAVKPFMDLEKSKLNKRHDLEDMYPSEVKDRLLKTSKRSLEELSVNDKGWDREDSDPSRHKMDKPRSRSVSSSGSRSRQVVESEPGEYFTRKVDSTGDKDKVKSKHKDDHRKSRKDEPYDPFDVDKSVSSESSSSSGSSSSSSSHGDSDEESFVERGSGTGSHSSTDYTRLQRERQKLLKQLQVLEEGGSTSDNNELLTLHEDQHKWKLPGVEQAKSQDPLAMYKPAIDTSQSFRKQMEAQRKREQLEQITAKIERRHTSPRLASKVEVDEDLYGIHETLLDKSPKEIPAQFLPVKKKRKPDSSESESHFSKRERVYRVKRSDDDDHGLVISGDEENDVSKSKLLDKSLEWACKPVTHEPCEKTSAIVEPMDTCDRDPRVGKIDPRSPHEARREIKSPLEIRTEPRIIPVHSLYPTDVKGDGRRFPFEPRPLPVEGKRDYPMNLPLPKFARQTQHHGPSPKASPKPHVSPKIIEPPQASPVLPKIQSPPFSPSVGVIRMPSPQSSPAFAKPDPVSAPKDSGEKEGIGKDMDTEEVCKEEFLSPPVVDTRPDEPKDNQPNSEEKMEVECPVLQVAVEPHKDEVSATSEPVKKESSDSEVNEPPSASLASLDERIRALDEKFERLSRTGVSKPPDSSSTGSTTSSNSTLDYREKFKIRKRGESGGSLSGGLTEARTEPSEIVKSIMAKQSVFDQDSRRLEQIKENYEPKDVNNSDSPLSTRYILNKSGVKDSSQTEFGHYPTGLPMAPSFQTTSSIVFSTSSSLSVTAPSTMSQSMPGTPLILSNSQPSIPASAPPIFSSPTTCMTISAQKSLDDRLLNDPQNSESSTCLTLTINSGVEVKSEHVSPVFSKSNSLSGPVVTVATATESLPSCKLSKTPSLPSLSSLPGTKKQDSMDCISPMPAPPPSAPPIITSVKREFPVAPVPQILPMPLASREEHRDPPPTITSILKKDTSSSSSSLLGKRKISDDAGKDKCSNNIHKIDVEKTVMPLKSALKSETSPSACKMEKYEKSETKSGEPEAKKAKVTTKEPKDKEKKHESNSKQLHRDSSKEIKKGATSKHSSKSPDKKHVSKQESKDGDKKSDDHVKHKSHNSKSKDHKDREDERREDSKEGSKDKESKIKDSKDKEIKDPTSTKSRDPRTQPTKDCSSSSFHKETSGKDGKTEKKEKSDAKKESGSGKVKTKSGESSSKHKDKERNKDGQTVSQKSKHEEKPSDRHKHKHHKTDKHDKDKSGDKTEQHSKDKTDRNPKSEKDSCKGDKDHSDKPDKGEKSKSDHKEHKTSSSSKHEKKPDKNREAGKHHKDGSRRDSGKDLSYSSSKDKKDPRKGSHDKNERKSQSEKDDKEARSEKSRKESDGKTDDLKEQKDPKDTKEGKEIKETKEQRENRELEELRILQARWNEEDTQLGYTSMYDFVKRRSNREREKEDAHKKMEFQKKLCQLQHRRRRSKTSRSDDSYSSEENSDEGSVTSASTLESRSLQRKSEPKAKPRKSFIFSSSDDKYEDISSDPEVPEPKKKSSNKKKNKSAFRRESYIESDDAEIVKAKTVKPKPKFKKKTIFSSDSSSSDDESPSKLDLKPKDEPETPKVKTKEKKNLKPKDREIFADHQEFKPGKQQKQSPKAKLKNLESLYSFSDSTSDSDDDHEIFPRIIQRGKNIRKNKSIKSDEDDTAEEAHIPKLSPKISKKSSGKKPHILSEENEGEPEEKEPIKTTPKPSKSKEKVKEKGSAKKTLSVDIEEVRIDIKSDTDMHPTSIISQEKVKPKKVKDKFKEKTKKGNSLDLEKEKPKKDDLLPKQDKKKNKNDGFKEFSESIDKVIEEVARAPNFASDTCKLDSLKHESYLQTEKTEINLIKMSNRESSEERSKVVESSKPKEKHSKGKGSKKKERSISRESIERDSHPHMLETRISDTHDTSLEENKLKEPKDKIKSKEHKEKKKKVKRKSKTEKELQSNEMMKGVEHEVGAPPLEIVEKPDIKEEVKADMQTAGDNIFEMMTRRAEEMRGIKTPPPKSKEKTVEKEVEKPPEMDPALTIPKEEDMKKPVEEELKEEPQADDTEVKDQCIPADETLMATELLSGYLYGFDPMSVENTHIAPDISTSPSEPCVEETTIEEVPTPLEEVAVPPPDIVVTHSIQPLMTEELTEDEDEPKLVIEELPNRSEITSDGESTCDVPVELVPTPAELVPTNETPPEVEPKEVVCSEEIKEVISKPPDNVDTPPVEEHRVIGFGTFKTTLEVEKSPQMFKTSLDVEKSPQTENNIDFGKLPNVGVSPELESCNYMKSPDDGYKTNLLKIQNESKSLEILKHTELQRDENVNKVQETVENIISVPVDVKPAEIVTPKPRKRGRPVGSKNKKKHEDKSLEKLELSFEMDKSHSGDDSFQHVGGETLLDSAPTLENINYQNRVSDFQSEAPTLVKETSVTDAPYKPIGDDNEVARELASMQAEDEELLGDLIIEDEPKAISSNSTLEIVEEETNIAPNKSESDGVDLLPEEMAVLQEAAKQAESVKTSVIDEPKMESESEKVNQTVPQTEVLDSVPVPSTPALDDVGHKREGVYDSPEVFEPAILPGNVPQTAIKVTPERSTDMEQPPEQPQKVEVGNVALHMESPSNAESPEVILESNLEQSEPQHPYEIEDAQDSTNDALIIDERPKEKRPKRGRRPNLPEEKDEEEKEEEYPQQQTQRSPVTRGRTRLDEAATPQFSSRGRKIIPKERDGELLIARKGRKLATPGEEPEPRGRGRRAAAANNAGNSESVTPDVGRPRRGRRISTRANKEDEETEKMEEKEPGLKEDEVDTKVEEPAEDSNQCKRVLRRTPRKPTPRRGMGTRSSEREAGMTDESEVTKEEDTKTEEDIEKEDGDSMEPSALEGSPRTRRSLRSKARKSTEGPPSSPRGRLESGSSSPRGRSMDGGTTSPKASEFSKPIVKLEKLIISDHSLKMDDSRKDEIISKEEKQEEKVEPEVGIPSVPSRPFGRFAFRHMEHEKVTVNKTQDQGGRPEKDLQDKVYDFPDEDEDEKFSTDYPIARPRKRKISAVSEAFIGNQEIGRKPVFDDVSQDSHIQDSKKPRVAESKAEVSKSETASSVMTDEKKEVEVTEVKKELDIVDQKPKPVPEVKAVDQSTAPSVSPQGELHLPPKLELKREHLEAQKSGVALVMTTSIHTSPIQSVPTPCTLTEVAPVTATNTTVAWQTNMDRIIEEVAKGNFDRGDDYDFYSRVKLPRSSVDRQMAKMSNQPYVVSVTTTVTTSSSAATTKVVSATHGPVTTSITTSSSMAVVGQEPGLQVGSAGKTRIPVSAGLPLPSVPPTSHARSPMAPLDVGHNLPGTHAFTQSLQSGPRNSAHSIPQTSQAHQPHSGPAHPIQAQAKPHIPAPPMPQPQPYASRTSVHSTGHSLAAGIPTTSHHALHGPQHPGLHGTLGQPRPTPVSVSVNVTGGVPAEKVSPGGALRSPQMHGAPASVIQPVNPPLGAAASNPMLALQKAGYPVQPQEGSSGPVDKDKDRVPTSQRHTPPTCMATPPIRSGGTHQKSNAGQAVHIGVVQQPACSISQREASPTGQVSQAKPFALTRDDSNPVPMTVIEKVPNPHMRSGPTVSQADARVSQSQSGPTPPHPSQHPHSHPHPPHMHPQHPHPHPLHTGQPGQPLPPVHNEPPHSQAGSINHPHNRMEPPHLIQTPKTPVSQQSQQSPHLPQPPKEGVQLPNPQANQHGPYMGMPSFPTHPHSHPQVPAGVMVSQVLTKPISQPSQMTSELRAALAQPSKLQQVQQAQMQQQRIHQQQQQQLRPGGPQQPERQSPGMVPMGHPRMPFPFQDPRPGVPRVEPKTSPGGLDSRGPPHFMDLHKGDPRMAGFPDMRMPHPGDPRPGMPRGDPRPGHVFPGDIRLQHPGMPYPMGVPKMPMDPRMMFAGQPHSDFIAQQGVPPHMLPGMVPQHPSQFLPHGITGDHPMPPDRPPSGRPPSGPTPPTSQPSPQGTPTPGHAPGGPVMHHGDGRVPPGPGGPPPPGSLPAGGHPGAVVQPSADAMGPHGDNLFMLLQRYPVMWQGLLALKNDCSAVQMHFVAGSKPLVKLALPPINPEGIASPLRIAQRMRLESTQLENVSRRMQDEEYSMLLALPCGRDHMDIVAQTRALTSGFIQYLQQKQAAGIVNVAGPQSNEAAYVVHIFPPCEFSQTNLSRLAPDLLQSVAELAHLLIIIATVYNP